MSTKKRILFIATEMSPYLELTEFAEIITKLAIKSNDSGLEVRCIMPRFGVINERRHRLHEVVRLSGINVSVDEDDYPLQIKVASLPNARLQVYFLENEDFLKYTNELVSTINEKNPANIEALTSLNMASGNAEEVRTQLVGKIGENITPRRFVRYQTTGQIFSYIHSGRIGVLLDLQGGDEALGKDLAMHIAANKPKALNASGIDAALIEVEKRVAIEKATEAGKPEAMLEKIAEGTVQKFLKEVTLLNQPFVKDDKVSVEQLLKANNATVNAFSIYSVAEGIEKAVVDYAAEVAAAAKV